MYCAPNPPPYNVVETRKWRINFRWQPSRFQFRFKELERIYQARAGCYEDADSEERIVRTVSARLVLPLDDVRTAIAESRGGIPGQLEMGGCESAPT
jgi:hypothetical protein